MPEHTTKELQELGDMRRNAEQSIRSLPKWVWKLPVLKERPKKKNGAWYTIEEDYKTQRPHI